MGLSFSRDSFILLKALTISCLFCGQEFEEDKKKEEEIKTIKREKRMLYNATQKVIQLSGGREIVIETGKLAKQADGSVVVRQGDTMLLATVVAAKEPKPDCGHSGVRTAFMTSDCSGTVLERPAREGESPVGETERSRAGSRVPRDTRNLVGSRRDHPPRLNTP